MNYYIILSTSEDVRTIRVLKRKTMTEAIRAFEREIKNLTFSEDEWGPTLQLSSEDNKTVALHLYEQKTTLYSKEAIISLL